MKKLFNAIAKGYNDFCDCGFHPIIAIILTVLFAFVGLAIGFGVSLAVAWCFMFVYNNLANIFHWPTFSIWFWFTGLYVIATIKRIFVPNKVEEE